MSAILITLLCFICFILGTKIKYIKSFFRNKKIKKLNKNEKYLENFEESDLKMVFLVRKDLKMGAGKIAAQVAHAAVGLFDDITSSDDVYHQHALNYWNTYGSKKIVLSVENIDILKQAAYQSKQLNIPYCMISDAGHTQVPAGSVTVLGIGPDESEKINKITGKFKLMN